MTDDPEKTRAAAIDRRIRILMSRTVILSAAISGYLAGALLCILDAPPWAVVVGALALVAILSLMLNP